MTDEQYYELRSAIRSIGLMMFAIWIVLIMMFISGCSAAEQTTTDFYPDGKVKSQTHAGAVGLFTDVDFEGSRWTLEGKTLETGMIIKESDSAAVTGLVEGVIGAGL